ncbi:N-acetylmuramoyl-L-alanine amidase family protein [Alkaliphilus peptidifermentans]|uniref:N-acetylmuramoyl-L-alanine amidase n=1 Tax=Alkaliphilus peptidifermentans DSM 18978 TaxID=1120976 RepID=A0A1G5ACP8_9FIRM|nr:N-acetylmuramoyl-L-alanine amidase [Alkaliphilus peptidifermentans]SCX75642.1 N-acetylmuramoyl-L-alanine amidase [Alkaliphilus peptidifermentans DSM 18978]
MSLQGKKILIDPGHGGWDSGAVGTLKGNQILEKDLALMFALSTQSYLENAGATVIMTRDSDEYIGINDRWEMGRDNSVNAVVSIHWNSGSGSAKGTETYYAQNRPQDMAFAQTIQNKVIEWMGTENRGVKDDTKSALGFLGVLRYPSSTSYPRALVEVEFISNETAMNRLDYPLYEASLDFAAGILKGLEEYFA